MDWPFADPPNVATITVRHVLEGSPILYVSHDADDGCWQFLAGGEPRTEDGRVVGLKTVVNLDPTVLELADLPLDWCAWRKAPDQPWQRSPHRGRHRTQATEPDSGQAQTLKRILRPDGARKVELYHRADGSFSFGEWYWAVDKQAWCPIGGFSACRTDTLERAEAEARGRVPWLHEDDP